MSSFNANNYKVFPGSTVPTSTYGPSKEMVGAGSNSGQANDLVSFIASQFNGGVNPNHVLFGLGLTFAGAVGGLIYWKSKEKRDSWKRPNFSETQLQLQRSRSRIGRGKSRLSIPEGVLILHQCPRGRKTPCIAPYPLKLETFLRMYGIKYEIDIDGARSTHSTNGNNGEGQGATKPQEKGQGAYVTVDLEETQDTQNCVKFICEKYSIDPQQHLDERQKSLERAFLHLLEHHIYWGISLYRWVYDGARSLEKIQYLPPATIASIPNVCRTVEQAAWFHGIGKKSPSEVVEDILRDLASMSRLLGEKKYFLSNVNPTELDCTAFAMLAQMYWTMDESPYYTAVSKTYKNLGDFCERIKKEFWPDWEQCLNNTPVLD